MSKVPIFDSLTHPSADGTWLGRELKTPNSLDLLTEEMTRQNICMALASGMGASENAYTEGTYASFIKNSSDKILPIALVNFASVAEMGPATYIRRLKTFGYAGVKIHPRLANIDVLSTMVEEVIREANQVDLIPLLCTYFWSNNPKLIRYSPESLLDLLCRVPDQRIILTHGGAVRLLEVAEICRQFPQAILDLSFTLCKYAGSSVDADIEFLFKNFDRRIVVGSDSPEFSLKMLRDRFNFFTRDLSAEKSENIAFKNLKTIFGVNT